MVGPFRLQEHPVHAPLDSDLVNVEAMPARWALVMLLWPLFVVLQVLGLQHYLDVKWNPSECQDPADHCILTIWSLLFTPSVCGFKVLADRCSCQSKTYQLPSGGLSGLLLLMVLLCCVWRKSFKIFLFTFMTLSPVWPEALRAKLVYNLNL